MFRSDARRGESVRRVGLGLALAVLLLVAMAGSAAAVPPYAESITNLEGTIKVVVASTNRFPPPLPACAARQTWGAVISGIYYRPSGTDWGPNLLDDSSPRANLGLGLHYGPPSLEWAGAGDPWPIPQACAHAPGNTMWATCITGGGAMWEGSTQIGFLTTHTPALQHTPCFPEPNRLNIHQTVKVYPKYVKIEYSLTADVPTVFQEMPCMSANAVDSTQHPETPEWARLLDAKLYDGDAPWNNEALTLVPVQPPTIRQVFPTEGWIGLFRQNDGYGLTVAAPNWTKHQPLVHHWSFQQEDYLRVLRVRPYSDLGFPEGTVSWSVYLIPGLVSENRKIVYDLLPHANWGFWLAGSTEGWVAINQLANFRTEADPPNGIHRLTCTSTGTQPYMYSLDQLDLAGDSYSGVKVRMAISDGYPPAYHLARVYYMTEDEQWFDENKARWLSIWVDGAYHEYFFQLDNTSKWRGHTIKRLMFVPVDELTLTDGIKIDYMQVVPYIGEWDFNAEGNNEGWLPVTSQMSDPVWPENVTGGSLIVNSLGTIQDPHASGMLRPTLWGPYPSYVPPPPTGFTRWLTVRMRFTGTGPYEARLRYTLSDDPKQFYYRSGNNLFTRFDYHSDVHTIGNLPAGQWVSMCFPLPTAGIIDQFELVPTDKAGQVEIDYITVTIV